jgi:hypothetical protein
MNSRAHARRLKVHPPPSFKPVPVKTSSHSRRTTPVADEQPSMKRERAVDPLWMIAVAMAFVFALLGLLATYQ